MDPQLTKQIPRSISTLLLLTSFDKWRNGTGKFSRFCITQEYVHSYSYQCWSVHYIEMNHPRHDTKTPAPCQAGNSHCLVMGASWRRGARFSRGNDAACGAASQPDRWIQFSVALEETNFKFTALDRSCQLIANCKCSQVATRERHLLGPKPSDCQSPRKRNMQEAASRFSLFGPAHGQLTETSPENHHGQTLQSRQSLFYHCKSSKIQVSNSTEYPLAGRQWQCNATVRQR